MKGVIVKIRVLINRKDLVLGTWLATLHTPWVFLYVALSVWVGYSIGSEPSAKDPMMVGIIITVSGFIVLITALLVLLAMYVMVNPKLKKGTLGEHTFEVTEGGFIESTAYNKTEHTWSSIDKIKKIFGYVLIRVSGHLWHIIPTRHFSKRSELEAFVEELRRRITEV